MKTGSELLSQDLDALENLFSGDGFKGKFDMKDWGWHNPNDDHKPAEHNYCGTSACLAGWLALVGGWAEWHADGELLAKEGSFTNTAKTRYGLHIQEISFLFLSGMDATLEEKIIQARQVVQWVKEREAFPAIPSAMES